MKKCIIFFLFFLLSHSYSQNNQIYSNDNIQISFPKEWKKVNTDSYESIKIAARKGLLSQTSFNLNVIEAPNSNLEKEEKNLLNAIERAKNFKLIQTGKKDINGNPFNWLIETHTNGYNKISEMTNFVFYTYFHEKLYVLTFACSTSDFQKDRPSFDKIVKSLRI